MIVFLLQQGLIKSEISPEHIGAYRNGVQILGSENMAKFHNTWNPFHMQHHNYPTEQEFHITHFANVVLDSFFIRTGVKSGMS